MAPTDRFPAAVQKGRVGPDNDLPHITPQIIAKYVTTTPAKSLPNISGSLYGRRDLSSPFRIFKSSGLTLAAQTWIKTSPSRSCGTATSTSATPLLLLYRLSANAFIVFPRQLSWMHSC